MRRLQRRREVALDLQARIAARSAELAADPAVERALRAIDGTASPTVTLAPTAGRTEGLRQIVATLARAANPVPGPAVRIELEGLSRLRGLVGAADLLLHDLAVDAGRLATLEHERSSRQRLLAEQRRKDRQVSEPLPANRSDLGRGQRIAEGARTVRGRTESLLSEESQARTVTAEVLEKLAADRDRFLWVVDAARASADALARPVAGSSVDAATLSQGLPPMSSRGDSPPPAAEPYARRLRELEKVIHSETLAVDVDKDLVWVDATIEGGHHLKMIVAPEAEAIRLAAATAAEAGIRPPDDGPTVEVATLDGRRFAARRARIESVQVGPSVVRDVECLVLPPEFGRTPPLLGGEFLKRFTTRIDPGAGKMTLSELRVKPILRGADPRR
jgi:hypothetical protein